MKKQIIHTSKAPSPIGPYSQAVRAGNTLYVSGQISIDPVSGELILSTLDNETHQVMANIGAILESQGLTFGNVVKSSIFLRNMDDFAKVNQIYGEYFKEFAPARETVQVSRLPKDVNVEISVIAVYETD
ncbi:MAG: RidA family protein [Bacteroidia bacterium]|nr:RidA family protein [Bacteroidia bacterium]